MSSAFSQFSASFARLSSLERRFIILVVVIIFVVVNLLFVLPYFSELGKIENRRADASAKLEKYDKEIAQIPFYEKNVKELEGEGASVPQEDQSVNFLTAINNQAAQSSVGILANNRQPERTNQFFIERSQALTTQSGEPQLVDFLYSLGSGNSLIRVRSLSIRPDAPRQALSATISLIASFQKKSPARTAPAARPASAPSAIPAAKPATPAAAPVVKTNKPAVKPPAAKPSTPTKK
jgi:Tfp pilus assembly protein PilO